MLNLDQIQEIGKSDLKDEEMVVFEDATLSWNCTTKKEKPKEEKGFPSKIFLIVIKILHIIFYCT